ncbi:MAG: transcriptional repressor LexA [Candidatus Gottesmanbacteria bacterium]|nr:transcriptional repressor LexA [Candidatus Gottesmanbacteria bacterium]
MTITPKQKLVLDFIKKFVKDNGYSPSLHEISKHFRKSISTAQHFVEELETRGFLQKTDNIARGISTAVQQFGRIFKLGVIAAGNPIEPIENPEPIDVPLSMISRKGDYYALEVKGTSMEDDNILDGDVIVVRHQNTASDGDRVVAITEKGATLKVYRKRNGKAYLEPRNKALNNIYPKELEIRGKFCGLIRQGD